MKKKITFPDWTSQAAVTITRPPFFRRIGEQPPGNANRFRADIRIFRSERNAGNRRGFGPL
mgnify:CR=1 FL=1